ncbi:hypothetical protein JGH11_13430 [Dysgonomonas sp. Marseille-P4677]|uniref:hypothetical protein n=1 Tax=Dysgonomonas sp. Marseille-P4677 TaxID=2364790 RepID=UPI001911548E|nr:hypothetical protein [Dysgonomonas sp. Marseille-P4677]MBK5721876.1 hypothetical protein [Dysgonomonas sp. Marseille-P4677]
MNARNVIFLLLLILSACKEQKESRIEGDYELNTLLEEDTKIYFSGSRQSEKQAYLQVEQGGIHLILQEGKQITLLKTIKGEISYPCSVRILRNGSYFRFWVGNLTAWIRGPLGEWKGVYEPSDNEVYAINKKDKYPEQFIVKKREWMTPAPQTTIAYGPEGSFYESQVIPGSILEYEDKYYMYLMTGMKGEQEGSSRRNIGLAVSETLSNWTVLPQPVIKYEDTSYDNLYVNGSVVTPDGKIAVMFSAQSFPEWKGFMLAIADRPEGPFTLYQDNPVYKHENAAHEFDLVDLKDKRIEYRGQEYRYILFYAGFTPKPKKNLAGDKGYLLYSNNLLNWVSHIDNPVFEPETKDNWDAAHVRPRSLNRIGDYWYLWYEGVNSWTPPGMKGDTWYDVIGLARSKDLVHWEYHPRNPVLATAGQDENICGYSWTGWPRMVIKDEMAWVFYCGHHKKNVSTTYKTIPVKNLTDWTSDFLIDEKQ